MAYAITGLTFPPRRASPTVLIADDDLAGAAAAVASLGGADVGVLVTPTAPLCRALVPQLAPDALVLCLAAGDDGEALVREVRRLGYRDTIIAVARDGRAATAVRLAPLGVLTIAREEYERALGEWIGGVQAERAEPAAAGAPAGGDLDAGDLVLGDLALSARARTAQVRGREVALSGLELDVLLHLARHAGAVVSREQLQRQVWHVEPRSETRAVDMVISGLRRKLAAAECGAVAIQTVFKRGYRLDVGRVRPEPAPAPRADWRAAPLARRLG